MPASTPGFCVLLPEEAEQVVGQPFEPEVARLPVEGLAKRSVDVDGARDLRRRRHVPVGPGTGDAEALAEERRLFYVGVTRARDVLEVNVPLRYHRHRSRLDDLHGFGQLSRFLSPVVQERKGLRPRRPARRGHRRGDGRAGRGRGRGRGVGAVDALLADLWS